MSRYALFVGANPPTFIRGGWDDFVASFLTAEEAKHWADRNQKDYSLAWAQVVDLWYKQMVCEASTAGSDQGVLLWGKPHVYPGMEADVVLTANDQWERICAAAGLSPEGVILPPTAADLA